MFVVIPLEWEQLCHQIHSVVCKIDERSPVKVILKPWNEIKGLENECLEFETPYLLVSGHVIDQSQNENFSDEKSIDQSQNENCDTKEKSKFSLHADAKWKKHSNIKNRTSAEKFLRLIITNSIENLFFFYRIRLEHKKRFSILFVIISLRNFNLSFFFK